MIKAQELRIGNIISSQSNLHRQVTVLQLFSDSYQGDFGNGNRGAMMYSTSDGIPLTSEWLERFGFEQNRGFESMRIAIEELRKVGNRSFLVCSPGSKYGNGLNAWIDIIEKNVHNEYLESQSVPFPCLYIHQLQNLYFALTGSELQLKDKTV